MPQALRHPDIMRIAQAEGLVTVERLAAHFGVTLQTIRRDLADLAKTGALERVHGGAVLPSGVSNIEYEERRRQNAGAKRRIAHACARLIPNDASVFLDIGTTAEAVARALLRHRNLLVVTNNMHVAEILNGNDDCELVVTGGRLRRADKGLVGPLAVRTIENFHFDYAVLGCSALTETGDMMDFDMDEVQVSQALLGHAREVILVGDASKSQRNAPVRIGSLKDVARFVTDRPIEADLSLRCTQWLTNVVVADRLPKGVPT